MDLREQYATAGVRRLWSLVQGLPPEAMLWIDMPKQDSPADESEDRPVATDPDDIRNTLTKLMGGG